MLPASFGLLAFGLVGMVAIGRPRRVSVHRDPLPAYPVWHGIHPRVVRYSSSPVSLAA